MSYCVNCGVELDGSAKECPLCNTPVINPRESDLIKTPSPFPQEKAQVEELKRADFGWLVTTVSLATAVTCGILNWLVFDAHPWSLAVIGACVLFWVVMIPIVIYHKWAPYLYLLLDGVTLALYLYLIARMVDRYEWFWGLGLPIVGWITLIAEILTLAICRFPRSFLTEALYFFTCLGIFFGGLEIEINHYIENGRFMTWSAVVVMVCTIIDIAIITTLSQRKLRNAVRRRLHF